MFRLREIIQEGLKSLALLIPNMIKMRAAGAIKVGLSSSKYGLNHADNDPANEMQNLSNVLGIDSDAGGGKIVR